jgi:hypothetical protein
MIHFTIDDVIRFFGYVDILPNGCWFWNGARSKGRGKKWYGSFRVGKRVVRAHRFSCDMVGKACPPDHHRDHSCVFSLCVNPFHIDIVTKEENVAQRWARRDVEHGRLLREKLVEAMAVVHPHLDFHRLVALQ